MASVFAAQQRSTIQFSSIARPNAVWSPTTRSTIQFVSVAAPDEGQILDATSQAFNVGARIELYVVDATAIGGDIYRFVPMAFSSLPVVWKGEVYSPFAASCEGFDSDSQKPATPKIRVSNVGNIFGAIVVNLGDLCGATFTRYRTFKQFLDGQSAANANANYAPDIFTVQRKSVHSQEFIEWELSAPTDQEQVLLPRRLVLKYTCTKRFRRWDPIARAFNYVGVECPYNGSQNGNKLYDASGNPVTDPALEACGRLDSDCTLRFPSPQALPTWAFAGVGGVHQ